MFWIKTSQLFGFLSIIPSSHSPPYDCQLSQGADWTKIMTVVWCEIYLFDMAVLANFDLILYHISVCSWSNDKNETLCSFFLFTLIWKCHICVTWGEKKKHASRHFQLLKRDLMNPSMSICCPCAVYSDQAVVTLRTEVSGSRPWFLSQQVVRLLLLQGATAVLHPSLHKVLLLLPSVAGTRANVCKLLEN